MNMERVAIGDIMDRRSSCDFVELRFVGNTF